MQKVKPYRAPKENNPFWPLPPDYVELTVDGQRQARVVVSSTQARPEDFVVAWDFFRNYYLLDARDDGFFFDDFKPSPPFHYQGVYDMAQYARNLLAAPRGFAKSSVFGTEVPLMLTVTRPYYKTTLCLATDAMVAERFDRFKVQIGDNQRVFDDFGDLKPKRGEGLWSNHLIRLTNGAFLQGRAVGGRKRGSRPHLFILDDPEYDPSGSTDLDELLSGFEWLLFRVIIPMLRPGCNAFWIGTNIHAKSFINYALTGEDERFEAWNRRCLVAENGPDELLWPEMWPYDALKAREQEIGASAYSGEYLNKPVSERERVLHINSKTNAYTIDEPLPPDPLLSMATLRYLEQDVGRPFGEDVTVETRDTSVAGYVSLSRPAGPFFQSMYRFMVVDYAASLDKRADFSCLHIVGFQKDYPNLWLLDTWMDRVLQDKLLSTIWDYGMRWLAHGVGVEAVGTQKAIAESVSSVMDARALDSGWRPRVFPIRYQRSAMQAVDKASRIVDALEWRLNRGRLKLPLYRRREPALARTFSQIDDFTMDLKFLRHDDGIDALAMSSYILPGVSIGQLPGAIFDKTPLDYVREGSPTDKAGFPRIFNLNDVPADELVAALDMAAVERYNRSKWVKPTPRIIGGREGTWSW